MKLHFQIREKELLDFSKLTGADATIGERWIHLNTCIKHGREAKGHRTIDIYAVHKKKKNEEKKDSSKDAGKGRNTGRSKNQKPDAGAEKDKEALPEREIVGKLEFSFELRDVEGKDSRQINTLNPNALKAEEPQAPTEDFSNDFRAKDGVLSVHVRNLLGLPVSKAYGISMYLE